MIILLTVMTFAAVSWEKQRNLKYIAIGQKYNVYIWSFMQKQIMSINSLRLFLE